MGVSKGGEATFTRKKSYKPLVALARREVQRDTSTNASPRGTHHSRTQRSCELSKSVV